MIKKSALWPTIFLLIFLVIEFILRVGSSASSVRQIVLFVVEVLIVVFIVHILNKAREQEHSLREQFQVILSSIGDGVIATDRKGSITYMNARSQRLLGIRFLHAHKKDILNILKVTTKSSKNEFDMGMKQVVHEGKTIAFNTSTEISTDRDSNLDIQYSLAPLRDMNAKIIGIVLIFRDVSEQKELESQREVILGSTSHELKNYITSIQGYSHILRKKLSLKQHEEAQQFAEKLNDKIVVMTEMVTGMLDLSKLKMGKLDMNIQEFDLEELTKSTIADMKINTDHKILITGNVDRHVKADRIRIGQVLTNLISNAIKYSPEKTKIVINLKQKQYDAIVSIQDHGQGISEDKIDKIFQPFYRAANKQDRGTISGSGLGLYVSKGIIEQNGGDIWVKSQEGKGSIFYFSLPSTEQLDELQNTPQQNIISRIRERLKFQYSAT